MMVVLFANVSALSFDDYEVIIDISSPNSANIKESWNVYTSSIKELNDFKENILKINVNIDELVKIYPDLEPRVYINTYKNTYIKLDEVNNKISIEYSIDDLVLIKYLDYKEEVIWKFNDNLLRKFVYNNLYKIPIGSYVKIKFYEPLFILENIDTGQVYENQISITGYSSNDFKLLFVEKKPPKPSFLLSNFFINLYFQEYFLYFILFLIVIALFLLLFKNVFSRIIYKFVIKNSVIKPKKKKKEVVDYEYFK